MKRTSGEAIAAFSKVRAVVRCRPLDKMKDGHQALYLSPQEHGKVELVDYRANPPSATQYQFDAAYDEEVSQNQVFQAEVAPHLASLFRGINSTIFCYGMTGAGKTHTMVGSNQDPGLIPRAVEALFAKIPSFISSNVGTSCHVGFSFFEIYNDKLYDLLDPKDKKCNVLNDSNNKIVIQGIEERPIKTASEFQGVFEKASTYRATAATNLNKDSSRSHAILIIKVTITSTGALPSSRKTTVAKLHLVDLAGSEDNRVTGNAGQRLTESSAINTSLSALNNVVKALNRGESYVPYRDSKLTRLLQDSLGGNSKSTIIANVAPGSRAFSNTQRTLEFAALSRAIVNTPSINVATQPTPVATAPPALQQKQTEAAPTPATNSAFDEAALERAIVEKMKKAGLDTLASDVKKLVEMERKKLKGPPKTPNTRTKEYQSHVKRSLAFEKDHLFLDALDELKTCYNKMQQDEMIVTALPSSMPGKLFKAVKTKITELTTKVNEATKKSSAKPAPAAASHSKPAVPIAKNNLLSSFNSANKENMTLSAANSAASASASAAGKRQRTATTKKRKRSPDEDDDESYDDAKNAEDAVSSESEEEPVKPAKPAPKRAKKVHTEEDEAAEREAAKQRVRDSLNTFGSEVHAEITKLVNIFNDGSLKEITKLHGIGKKRADLIIAHRSNGPIRAIEQLLDVQGISEKILDNIIKTNVIAGVFFDRQKEEARHFESLQTQQRAEYMMEVDPIMDS